MAVTLTIDNSISKIDGLTSDDVKSLSKDLSYSQNPQASYFSKSYSSQKISLLTKRGDFPTGLLYLVHDYLYKNHILYTVKDLRIPPSPQKSFPIATLLHTPYPTQKNAAKAALNASRGVIVAPTGTGKSIIAILIVQAVQVPTLIVVPSLELKKQLTQSFKNAFGSKFVGNFKDGKLIAIDNVDALDLAVVSPYDCIILDEFHHSGASTYRKLNKKAWTKAFYRFGLTATPFRSQDNERLLLESVLSQVIYRVDYQKAVSDNQIVPMEAYYIDLPKVAVDSYTWSEVYSKLVVENDYRNKIISNLILNLNENSVPTICLVKEIAHGLNIQAYCKDIHFVKGENDNNREKLLEFNLGERKCLIGTTGTLGEGVDSKPCEFVIIAGLGRSKNAFMQQVGRAFRTSAGKESCKVILFRDDSHKFTIRHFKEQVKILKDEYGVVPIKLNIY